MTGGEPQFVEQKKPNKQLPLPVPKLTTIDREIPMQIQSLMGKNWIPFRTELMAALREHSATVKDVGEFLAKRLPLMQKIIERLHRIPDISRRIPEDYFYIVASIFVAGYLHGVDPLLMLAMAQRESSFKQGSGSSRGARGYLQVTASSALSELFSKERALRTERTRIFRIKLAKLTDIEFTGLKNPVNIRWTGKTPILGREEERRQRYHALHNAIWAARTLIMKYPGVTKDSWGIGNSKRIMDALKKYQGGSESYAQQVYNLYVSIYKPIEDEMRISALAVRSKAPKI